MSRVAPWRRIISDVVVLSQLQAQHSTIYILRETGPTGFILKEEGVRKELRVLIGNEHSCSCSSFTRTRDLCKHICWILLKKFRLSCEDPMAWQQGLLVSEVNNLVREASAVNHQRSVPDDGNEGRNLADEGQLPLDEEQRTLRRRDIKADDACPICQEELLASHRPVTYCRYGCGNNVHIKCMKIYAEHQLKTSSTQTISCPLCRTDFGAMEELVEEYRTISFGEGRIERANEHPCLICCVCFCCPVVGRVYRCVDCSGDVFCLKCFRSSASSNHLYHNLLYRTNTKDGWRQILPGSHYTQVQLINSIADLQTRVLSDREYKSLIPADRAVDTAPNDLTEESLRAFPVQSVREGSSLLHRAQQCCLCLRGYSVGEKVRLLPCHHRYHKLCIDNWLLHQNPSCPIDQVVYTVENIRLIKLAEVHRKELAAGTVVGEKDRGNRRAESNIRTADVTNLAITVVPVQLQPHDVRKVIPANDSSRLDEPEPEITVPSDEEMTVKDCNAANSVTEVPAGEAIADYIHIEPVEIACSIATRNSKFILHNSYPSDTIAENAHTGYHSSLGHDPRVIVEEIASISLRSCNSVDQSRDSSDVLRDSNTFPGYSNSSQDVLSFSDAANDPFHVPSDIVGDANTRSFPRHSNFSEKDLSLSDVAVGGDTANPDGSITSSLTDESHEATCSGEFCALSPVVESPSQTSVSVHGSAVGYTCSGPSLKWLRGQLRSPRISDQVAMERDSPSRSEMSADEVRSDTGLERNPILINAESSRNQMQFSYESSTSGDDVDSETNRYQMRNNSESDGNELKNGSELRTRIDNSSRLRTQIMNSCELRNYQIENDSGLRTPIENESDLRNYQLNNGFELRTQIQNDCDLRNEILNGSELRNNQIENSFRLRTQIGNGSDFNNFQSENGSLLRTQIENGSGLSNFQTENGSGLSNYQIENGSELRTQIENGSELRTQLEDGGSVLRTEISSGSELRTNQIGLGLQNGSAVNAEIHVTSANLSAKPPTLLKRREKMKSFNTPGKVENRAAGQSKAPAINIAESPSGFQLIIHSIHSTVPSRSTVGRYSELDVDRLPLEGAIAPKLPPVDYKHVSKRTSYLRKKFRKINSIENHEEDFSGEESSATRPSHNPMSHLTDSRKTSAANMAARPVSHARVSRVSELSGHTRTSAPDDSWTGVEAALRSCVNHNDVTARARAPPILPPVVKRHSVRNDQAGGDGRDVPTQRDQWRI